MIFGSVLHQTLVQCSNRSNCVDVLLRVGKRKKSCETFSLFWHFLTSFEVVQKANVALNQNSNTELCQKRGSKLKTQTEVISLPRRRKVNPDFSQLLTQFFLSGNYSVPDRGALGAKTTLVACEKKKSAVALKRIAYAWSQFPEPKCSVFVWSHGYSSEG